MISRLIYVYKLFLFDDLQFGQHKYIFRTLQAMKLKPIERCLIVAMVWGLVLVVMAQQGGDMQHQSSVRGKQESGVEKQQYQLEQQFKNQQQSQLTEQIVQEIKHNQQYHEVLPYQSVTFLLQPHAPQIYRIPVSLAQEMLIQISLYQISKQGFLVLPQSPDQQTFVEVQTIDSIHGQQHNEGKVYIQKTISLKFNSKHKYLKFTNKGSHPLIAVLDIEQQDVLMQIIVSDDQFALTNKKIQMILQQTKQSEVIRQHIYKWQWGFYEKLWRHQSDMLGFTGAQLLVIVVTSIVQMYCIKNLINNELII